MDDNIFNRNRFNRRNFNNRPPDPEDFLRFISKALEFDDSTDTSLGAIIEESFNTGLNKGIKLSGATPIKIEDFTQEVKLAINDCFNGDLISDGLGSICYILPDKTVFKIQITKL